MLDCVCIVACGKGSRLLPLTVHIPKILVNLKNENILKKIITYWKKYTHNFVLVINKEYNTYVDFYLKDFSDISYSIRNVEINNGEENSYTIKESLSDLVEKKVIITWCDIYPREDIDFSKITENCVFVNNYWNFKSRYLADSQKQQIEKVSDYHQGNVIGIYYVHNFHPLQNDNDKQDLCDCFIQNYGKFQTYDLEIIDVGDKEKINKYFASQEKTFSTRYFNSISIITGEILEKKSICEYGDLIIKKEIAFYRFLQENNIPYPFPKIHKLGETSFQIEYIRGQNLYEKICSGNSYKEIYNLLTFLKQLYNNPSHSISVSKEIVEADIRIETLDKINGRFDKVSQILNEFSYVEYCNNVKIDTYESITKRIKKITDSFLQKRELKYNVVHGDLNLSNILVTNDSYVFIDPRGYFGNTKIHGLPYYDIAKIYFSLFGFDSFNISEQYYFSLLEDNIMTNINMPFDKIPIFSNLYDNEEYEFILCLSISVWLGLPFYFKDNISKIIGSYFYSRYLATIYLDKIENLIKNRKLIQCDYYNKIQIKKTQKDISLLEAIQKKEFVKNTQPSSFKNKIIKKPWGFEFIATEFKSVSMLVLHIQKDQSTSMHCHRNKDTPILLAQGKMTVKTLDKTIEINVGDICMLNRDIFHSLESWSDDTIILEFEVMNPNREDLLRYEDKYQRQNQGYEGVNSILADINANNDINYFDYSAKSPHQDQFRIFKNSKIYFKNRLEQMESNDIIVCLNGFLFVEGVYYHAGTILRFSEIANKQYEYLDDFRFVQYKC
jgi:choline kinase/quercetin dioxygenase-like cupin family protein